MRILIITNYYPPSDYGWGYMQLCEEVADGLSAKGHEIAVLTSARCNGLEISRPYPVHRWLHIDPDWHSGQSAAWQFFVGRKQREAEDVAHLQKMVAEFQPDLLFVWHAIGLSRVMLKTAEALPQPTVYYFAGYLPELSDEHIEFWQKEPVHWTAKLLKQPLAKIALNMLRQEGKPIRLSYEHVICVSDYVRQRLVKQDLIPEESVVVHNGVDLTHFATDNKQPEMADVLHCLVAGRINAEKGIHTTIEAFRILSQTPHSSRLKLHLLGDGPADYVQEMRHKVDLYGLQDTVVFMPPVPRSQMPEILAQHQILILPSEYAEPIARSMQEGMAMGLLVIGTTTGGSGELLEHEKTGLVFTAGDAQSLATQLGRAIIEPELMIQISLAGQVTVKTSFTIERTTDKVEQYLKGILAQTYQFNE